MAFVSILSVVSISVILSKYSLRFYAYIGASSMSIYLMHILTGSGIRVVLSSVLGVDSFVIHLILGFLAGLLLPLVALKLINVLNIPYVFSAPVSKWLERAYCKLKPSEAKG